MYKRHICMFHQHQFLFFLRNLIYVVCPLSRRKVFLFKYIPTYYIDLNNLHLRSKLFYLLRKMFTSKRYQLKQISHVLARKIHSLLDSFFKWRCRTNYNHFPETSAEFILRFKKLFLFLKKSNVYYHCEELTNILRKWCPLTLMSYNEKQTFSPAISVYNLVHQCLLSQNNCFKQCQCTSSFFFFYFVFKDTTDFRKLFKPLLI